MSIVWIASYPKSGNTWVRFMLYAALYGTPEQSGDVPKRIPDLHRKMPFQRPESGPVYMKTHLQLTDEHPMLDKTLKAVHIIRNPKDILLSAINYRKLADGKGWAAAQKSYIKSFLKAGGDADWHKMNFGSWASHARTWRTTTKFPVLELSYEQLKSDPRGELVRMMRFLEIDRTGEQIDQAVRASSFEFMKAMEIREKNADKGKKTSLNKNLFVGTMNATRKGLYFMNEGKTNQSLDHLYPGLDQEFDLQFKDALEEFGYTGGS